MSSHSRTYTLHVWLELQMCKYLTSRFFFSSSKQSCNPITDHYTSTMICGTPMIQMSLEGGKRGKAHTFVSKEPNKIKAINIWNFNLFFYCIANEMYWDNQAQVNPNFKNAFLGFQKQKCSYSKRDIYSIYF